MNQQNIFKLVGSIILCELAGIIGSVFTVSSIPTWYAALTKPALNPPNWIFGPVWTTLYFLMGVALYLVWTSKKGKETQHNQALWIFFIQLALNTAWSIIFFGLESPGVALIEILIMWSAIAWTIKLFYPLSKLAAYLLVPYILWVSFATYLTYSIWILNPPL
jgi:tryptophan-rich sensory protein